MSPQQQEAHRVKIGVRASAILGQFWRNHETPEVEQVMEIEGWQDVLENCSHSEIRQAWAEWQKTGPRTEARRLVKPDAGALYGIILKNRPKPKLVPRPVVERDPPCSKEAAKEIMKSAGYSPRKFGGTK